MSPVPGTEVDKAASNGHSPVALLEKKQARLPKQPKADSEGIVVPAAVVDTLVTLALSSEAGKGIMLGFRATVGAPQGALRLVVQDARLVPAPETP